jgi:tetratricopeptide (TPR) repeat protein
MPHFRPPRSHPTIIRRARQLKPVSAALLMLLLSQSPLALAAQLGGGGFVVFGRVSLPDGRPAVRVRVYIETLNGLRRDTLSDDQGNYEFRGMAGGRYRVSATNPNDPKQFSEPAESDTTRAYSNRLQINVYLRYQQEDMKKQNLNPGKLDAALAAQDIPKEARKAYEQGLELQKEKRHAPALAEFTRAVELFPDYFQALAERGNLLMAEGRLAEAEADFARSLQVNEKYAPALRGIGYCQLQQKKFGEALGNLERAYAREPDVPLTLLLLGYANLSLNRYEEARQCLTQALKLGPESAARAHVYLAEIYAHEQKFREAADEVRKYLSAKPGAADAAQLKKLEDEWRARGRAAGKQP